MSLDYSATFERLRVAGIRVALIAALDQQRAIGQAGTLPWHIPEDLKRFKTLTLGHSVLMGRKTFASLPKALPNRRSLVLTRNATAIKASDTLDVLTDLAQLQAQHVWTERSPTLWVIGGAEIYALCLPYADQLELTWVEHAASAPDAFFPAFDAAAFAISADTQAPGCRFVSYARRAYTTSAQSV
jgi:dihydrofolate reductase